MKCIHLKSIDTQNTIITPYHIYTYTMILKHIYSLFTDTTVELVIYILYIFYFSLNPLRLQNINVIRFNFDHPIINSTNVFYSYILNNYSATKLSFYYYNFCNFFPYLISLERFVILCSTRKVKFLINVIFLDRALLLFFFALLKSSRFHKLLFSLSLSPSTQRGFYTQQQQHKKYASLLVCPLL